MAQQYLSSHRNSPSALILLARAEMAMGKNDVAFNHLIKALQLRPNDLDTLYYLGWVSAALSNASFRDLYALAPDSSRVHQLMAESLRAQQKPAEAEREYRAALNADPNSLDALDGIGNLLREQSRYDDALVYYQRALAAHPRDYDSTYGAGVCLMRAGESAEAIEHFRRAIALDPKSAAAHFALADGLLQSHEPAAAIPELQSALALAPNMREAYGLLAKAYRALGDERQAEAALAKASQLATAELQSAQQKLGRDELRVPNTEPTKPPQ